MRRFRSVAALIAVIVMTASAASCGENEDAGSATKSSTSNTVTPLSTVSPDVANVIVVVSVEDVPADPTQLAVAVDGQRIPLDSIDLDENDGASQSPNSASVALSLDAGTHRFTGSDGTHAPVTVDVEVTSDKLWVGVTYWGDSAGSPDPWEIYRSSEEIALA